MLTKKSTGNKIKRTNQIAEMRSWCASDLNFANKSFKVYHKTVISVRLIQSQLSGFKIKPETKPGFLQSHITYGMKTFSIPVSVTCHLNNLINYRLFKFLLHVTSMAKGGRECLRQETSVFSVSANSCGTGRVLIACALPLSAGSCVPVTLRTLPARN